MSGPEGDLRDARILLVEDARATRDLIARALGDEGSLVTAVGSCAAATTALRSHAFRAVILDIGLPDGSGVDVCREWRRAGDRVPVLILTARADVGSRVAGLDAGADDYLSKPFAFAELRARLRALLRRTPGEPIEHFYEKEGLHADFLRRRVTRRGKEVPVTRRELEVLERLARARGLVVLREELLEEIWGEATAHTAASLDVMIGRLRKKLDAPGSERLIRTVRGLGYALERGDTPAAGAGGAGGKRQ